MKISIKFRAIYSSAFAIAANVIFSNYALAQGVAADSGERLVWYVTRSAAVSAYILMFLVIILGTGMTMGFAYKLFNPVRAWAIHQYLGITLGLMILLHIFSLLFDRFMNFSALDIFVPFYSEFKPLFLSAGIVAFYLLVSVLATSLILRNRKPVFWRTIHYWVYPFFFLSLVHGLSVGSDSHFPAMQAMYGFTGIIVILVTFYRIFGRNS